MNSNKYKKTLELGVRIILILVLLSVGSYLVINFSKYKGQYTSILKTEQNSHPGWVKYVNEKYQFIIEHPPDLLIKEESENKLSINTDPPGYPSAFLETIEKPSQSKEIADLSSLSIGQSGAVGPTTIRLNESTGYNIFKRLPDTTINGVKTMVFENSNVREFAGKERKWLLIENSPVFLFTLDYLNDGELDKYQAIFSSLKFTQLDIGADIFQCQSDSDCVVPTGQCSCSEKAINRKFIETWITDNPPQKYCPTVICTQPKAICKNYRCIAKR